MLTYRFIERKSTESKDLKVEIRVLEEEAGLVGERNKPTKGQKW